MSHHVRRILAEEGLIKRGSGKTLISLIKVWHQWLYEALAAEIKYTDWAKITTVESDSNTITFALLVRQDAHTMLDALPAHLQGVDRDVRVLITISADGLEKSYTTVSAMDGNQELARSGFSNAVNHTVEDIAGEAVKHASEVYAHAF